jgi:Phosphoribosylformylglycinamidine (FGAM) synthase, synthetase domain
MILFFRTPSNFLYAVGHAQSFSIDDIQKLIWLFGGAKPLEDKALSGYFLGPRKEMVTPWSTNAVEITQTMGIVGIQRIEEFLEVSSDAAIHDRMLQRIYKSLDQELFTIHHTPEPIIEIENIAAYNEKEGLALSQEEIEYLNDVSWKLGRKLTDSEVFGFSQVNSEHCRHKIFNGPSSSMEMKKT